MNFLRARVLFLTSLRAGLNRWRFSLAQEVVVLICGLVLLGLFFYVFNGLINTEVAKISASMQQQVGLGFSALLLLAIGLMLGHRWALEKSSDPSLPRLAIKIGEDSRTLKLYWILRIPTLTLLYGIPGLMIVRRFLTGWDDWVLVPASIAILAVACVGYGFETRYQLTRPLNAMQNAMIFDQVTSGSRLAQMVRWRVTIFLLRNRTSQLIFLTAILLACMVGPLGRPLPIAAIGLAFGCGWLISQGLALQIADDFAYSWLEKNAGIDHKTYLRTLKIVTLLIGSTVALIAAASTAIAFPFDLSARLVLAAQVLAITLTPSLILPSIVMQIDPRRPGVQAVVLALVGLFIGTAIYASLWSILLLPILANAADQSQENRFYRA